MCDRRSKVILLAIIYVQKNYSVKHSLFDTIVLIILYIFSMIGSGYIWSNNILIWETE